MCELYILLLYSVDRVGGCRFFLLNAFEKFAHPPTLQIFRRKRLILRDSRAYPPESWSESPQLLKDKKVRNKLIILYYRVFKYIHKGYVYIFKYRKFSLAVFAYRNKKWSLVALAGYSEPKSWDPEDQNTGMDLAMCTSG